MNRKGDFLKILAMLTMLIDHVGFLYYPSALWLRIIGRLAFPIFAFLIARGYRYTSDKRKYMLRLFVFGIISQIPYHYFVPGKLNIMFTLLIGLVIIQLSESKYRLLMPVLFLTGFYPPMSYGVYGLVMIYLFHMSYGDRPHTAALYLSLSLMYLYITSNWVQACSVMALVPILFEPNFSIRLPKAVGYWFYPVHILVLMGLKHIL